MSGNASVVAFEGELNAIVKEVGGYFPVKTETVTFNTIILLLQHVKSIITIPDNLSIRDKYTESKLNLFWNQERLFIFN